MPLHGFIFDIDGTLIDTNPAHVEAWQRAFRRFGFDVPRERIVPEIGKGGDKLVPSVLGEEIERQIGEDIRKAQKEEFLAIARRTRFRVFPGTVECFLELRRRGLRTAVATSSDQKHLEATLASADLELSSLADRVITRGPSEASKPSPDVIIDALEALAVPAAQCAMVGDTIYDGLASRAAGVVFLGVLTGPATESELLEAGARGVWRDVGHLAADLDRALEVASLAAAASS
jgi:phosphoglycolate phosphatase-like HAD superfamily hydrolase